MTVSTILASLLLLAVNGRMHCSALASPHLSCPSEGVGLALAGGSLRAASTCMGVLRGFQQKRVTNSDGESVSAMDKVGYNSGISGGSIPAILYSYAQVPVDQLLDTGRVHEPAEISLEELNTMAETSMGYAFIRKPRQRLRMLIFLGTLLMRPTNIFRMHSFWALGVFKKACDPFHIPKNKFFTSGEEALQRILKENSNLTRDQFLLPRDDVTALPMILFSMLGSKRDLNRYMHDWAKVHDKAWEEYQAQQSLDLLIAKTSMPTQPNMTETVLANLDELADGNLPIPFVATPNIVETRYSGTVHVRGEQVEFPVPTSEPFNWGSNGLFGRKRFSVELLASMSTNFIGSSVTLPAQIVTNFRHINLDNDGLSMTLAFADGGTSDLMGILPLIQHKVKKIVSVYNFNQNPPHATLQETTYADIYRHANVTSLTDPDFDIHFQNWMERMNPRITCYFGYFGQRKISQANVLNHVFNDPGLDRLRELMIKMNSLFKAGEPLIVTLKDLEVIDNPFWGISSGHTVDLTLMYFNMPNKFSEAVPIEAVPPPEGMSKIDEDGRFNHPDMKSIPELNPDGANCLRYTNAQINMMGYLGSWMVHHSWDGLRGHDGEVGFDGFREIFE